MFWDIVTSNLFWHIAGPLLVAVFGAIYIKWPAIRRMLRPDDFQQSIITDRDELQKEADRLFRFKECLLDEVIVLRKVLLVKTALLDEANAEITTIRSGTRKIQDIINSEQRATTK